MLVTLGAVMLSDERPNAVPERATTTWISRPRREAQILGNLGVQRVDEDDVNRYSPKRPTGSAPCRRTRPPGMRWSV